MRSMGKPGIRLTIFTLFITLLLLAMGVMMATQYHFNERYAFSAAEQGFQSLTENLERKRQTLAIDTRGDLNLLATTAGLEVRVTDAADHPALPQLLQLLENRPHAYAVYIGQANGDFYEVINLASDPQLYKLLQAPPEARWAVISLSADDDHQRKQYRFLNPSLQPVGHWQENTRYRPQSRPWFKNAQRGKGVVKTGPYLFSHLNSTGVTFSVALSDQAVLAMDYTLSYLGKSLLKNKPSPDARLFVFDQHGRIQFSEHKLDRSTVDTTLTVPETQRMALTEKEKAFVASAPVFRVSNQRDWPPFDYVEKGHPRGYSIDLMRLLAAKTGLQFQFVNDYSFQAMLQAVNQGGLDIVHSLFRSEEREALGDFTRAHFETHNAFITRRETDAIGGFSQLSGKTLAMVAGWTTTEFIAREYPDIELQRYDDIMSALKAVAKGQADATIDTPESFRYLKQAYGLDGLMLNRTLPQNHFLNDASLYMLVSKDLPQLHALLNRALDHLAPETRMALNRRWGLERDEAHSEGLDRAPPPLLAAMKASETPSRVTQFRYDGQTWLGGWGQLPESESGARYLGMMIPKATVLGPYRNMMHSSALAALVILMLMLPLIWLLTSRLVEPIYRLRHLASLVKKKRYDRVQPVDSHIRELHHLSHAMYDMALGVRDYEAEQAKAIELKQMFVDHLQENEKVLEARVLERTRALEATNQALEASREKLRYQAYHDGLTGLPNRQAFNQKMQRWLTAEEALPYHDGTFALLVIDLNRFKPINDTHGHKAGDSILVEVADRLSKATPESALLARVGGDEFVILWPDVDDHAHGEDIKQSLLASVEGPCDYEGVTLMISLSIGVALYPTDAKQEAPLFCVADEAMYAHKQARRMAVR